MKEKELQLQPRLQCIAGLVPRGARLADVGTDHGYLPVYLLQQGVIAHAIASDINKAPLDHARATAREYGVEEKMDFRLCPGLAGIKAEETDTIAIAGMGGETILSILKAAPWTCDGAHTLILQPQTKIALLRRWLVSHGFAFLKETLVRDKGQLYAVLVVSRGEMRPLSEGEALCGALLGEDPLYGALLDEQLQKLARAAQGLAVSSLGDKNERIDALTALIAELTEKKKEWSDALRT